MRSLLARFLGLFLARFLARFLGLFLASALLVACDDDPPEPAAPADQTEAQAEAETQAEAEAETQAEAEPEPEPGPPDPHEACAEVVVVAWQGAEYADESITRSEEEARARAAQTRTLLEGGADFAATARERSDARTSRERGGMLGTYEREDWPEAHGPIEEGVFALRVGELSQPLRAPYGWVIARRCAVEKVNTRHILIRYTGARRAPEEITRSREEAQALATEVHREVTAEGADFAAIARERSEDGSAQSGGEIGAAGRGRLDPAYERAAFALEDHAISGVVESAFGFHIIQRLPLEGAEDAEDAE